MRAVGLLALLAVGCGSSTDGAADARAAAGDGSPGTDAPVGAVDANGGSADAPVGGATDFTVAGPRTVATTTGSMMINGCDLSYTVYTPSGGDTATLVVLGHGFSRTADNVAEIAEHIASFGARVVTPSYCHSTALDTDHQQNGVDAAALSAALRGSADVIHAGHSAGGVSALVAATNDAATVAVLGLDMTDASSIGATAAASLSVPSLGLFGAPGSCNGNGNGRAVFSSMSMSTELVVTDATHCDFEAPTSGLCTAFCGGTDATRAATVVALASAFVAWRAGLDSTGEAWVSAGGSELSRLVGAGQVELLP